MRASISDSGACRPRQSGSWKDREWWRPGFWLARPTGPRPQQDRTTAVQPDDPAALQAVLQLGGFLREGSTQPPDRASLIPLHGAQLTYDIRRVRTWSRNRNAAARLPRGKMSLR